MRTASQRHVQGGMQQGGAKVGGDVDERPHADHAAPHGARGPEQDTCNAA